MTLSEKFESVTADVRREAIAVLNSVPDRYEFQHDYGELFNLLDDIFATEFQPGFDGPTIRGENEHGAGWWYGLDEINTENLCAIADFFTEKNAIQ